MASTSYRNIEPLTKSNYDTWCLQAQAVLIKNDYWDIVSGNKSLSSTADAAAKSAFEKEDLKARAEILLLLSPSELKQIKTCTSSKSVWDKLKATYQSTGPARKATLLKQLVLKRMTADEDIRDHLNNFMDVVDKLADMEIKIPPELLSIMLLYSLPTSFENFRIAIESRDTLPNPDDLKVKILEEYQARSGNEAPESSEAYHFKKNKTKLYCKNCKKKGHTTEACWGKKDRSNEKPNRSQSKTFNVCLSTASSSTDKNMWCLDSGCSSHMCGDKTMFSALTPENGTLKLASNKYTSKIEGKGKVTVSQEKVDYNFKDTLFVPDVSVNLLSVGKIADRGHKVIFEKDKAYIVEKSGEVSLTAQRRDGLYYFEFEKKEVSNYTRKSNDCDLMEWHRKLGHINERDLKKMAQDNLMYGLRPTDEKLEACETCIKGKLSRLPFTRHDGLYTTEKLEIIHSDVCGPFECETLAGSRYYVTFIDDFTRYCHVYFIKKKSDVFNTFKQYKSEVETFHNKKIKHLQTDNGTEYRNKEFDDFLKLHGIQRRLTTVYTPQQNGTSERKNRSLLDKARCLLIEANAPKKLWAEAVHTANYLINRSPSKALNGEIPFTKWIDRTPSGNHLHVFGRKTFVLKKNRRGKLTQHAKEGVFMGYSLTTKGYRVYIPEDDDMVISRDIKVIDQMYFKEKDTDYENLVYKEERHHSNTPEKEKENKNKRKKNKIRQEIEIEITERKNDTMNNEIQNPENLPLDPDDLDENESFDDASEIVEIPENGRPQRERRPPAWTRDYVLDETEESQESHLLNEITYLSDENENDEYWHDAIKAEIRAHVKNGTWKVEKKGKDVKVVDYKMVLRNKVGPDDSVTRKARLVARGFTQRPGIDYNDTYAPVAKLSSIRSVIGVAVEEELNLNQMDVTTAYLNGELEEKIVMKYPDYLEEYLTEIMVEESTKEDLTIYNKTVDMLRDIKNNPKEKVCCLIKALYGLKQAGRQWYKKLDTELKHIGFRASEADPCVYLLEKRGVKIIIVIYVDDLLIAYSCPRKLKEVKDLLNSKFELKDLGRPKRLIGIDMIYNKEGIKICQQKFIEDTLKKFKMEDCKTTSTPMEPGLKLERCGKDESQHLNLPYKNLIGTLMYLAVATRPDIMFAISYLSQFNDCHKEEHFKCAKRVLRYLKATKNVGLTFTKTGQDMHGMADADWGSCKLDRKSFSGYCFKYAGTAISWMSKKQKSVALSTAEAEYVALTEAAKEAIHLKSLFKDLGADYERVVVAIDNQAALKLSQNSMVTSKSKHIDLKMHFIRNCIQEGAIDVKYLRTEDMEADLLTKALAGPRLMKLRSSLGLS